MFGVLVIIFGADSIADLGLSTGERQIPLILSLRILSMSWLGPRGT